MQNHSNIILTGIPRSGTSLTCSLLNKLSNVVALVEPKPPKSLFNLGNNNLKQPQEHQRICNELESWFETTRESILTRNIVQNCLINGEVADNFVSNDFSSQGKRLEKAYVMGELVIDKKLESNFLLCIKHNFNFTAILSSLTSNFTTFGIIRNPLSVLASWNTVSFPVTNGRAPAAEQLSPQLAKELQQIDDKFERQLQLLSWGYEQYFNYLPDENILRYEDLISSGGKSLQVITTEASVINESLSSKNNNPIYDKELISFLGQKLLDKEGAFWKFYSKQDVKNIVNTSIFLDSRIETSKNNNNRQTVIAILGMHRSGTSCLAGSLQAGGLFAGEVGEYSPGNIKGHRENQDIIAINEDILASNNSSWDNPPATITWTDKQRQQRDKLISKFSSQSLVWMFKDPRSLLTLPFWQEGIPNLELIGTFRHPLTAAMSLYQRSKNSPVSLQKGIKLWIDYNRILLNAYQQSAFPLICFDLPKESYLSKLQLIVRDLNRKLTEDSLLDLEKTIEFYQSKLINQHQRNSNLQITKQKSINKENSLIAIAEEIYQNLKDAAGLENNTLENNDFLVPLENTIEACQEIILLQPYNDNAYYLLGNAQKNEGKIEDAIVSYQKAIKIAPNNFYYYRNLGDVLISEDRIEEALESYHQVLELQPDNFQIYYLFANLHAKNNDMELAITSYKKAIEFASDYCPSYLGLAKIYAQQGQLKKASQLCKQALSLQPNQAHIYLQLGDINLKQNELDNALLNYQKAQSLNPKNELLYLRMGTLFFQQNKIEAAIAQYQEGIRLNPNDPYSYILLGNAVKERGDLEDAIIIYKKAINLNPKNAGYYNIVGNIQKRLENYNEAIFCYRNSLELNPQQYNIFLALANTFSKINDTKNEIAVFRKAIELFPSRSPANTSLGHICQKLGALRGAIFLYERAIAIEPNQSFAVYKRLADALNKLGEISKARSVYKKAIELFPERSSAYQALGYIQQQSGKISDAITLYEKAIKLDPKQSFAVYKRLGDALSQQGRISEAISAYTNALQLQPNNEALVHRLGNLRRCRIET